MSRAPRGAQERGAQGGGAPDPGPGPQGPFPPRAQIKNVKFNARKLGELIRRGGKKFGGKVEKIGRRIKEFFTNLTPREEEEA